MTITGGSISSNTINGGKANGGGISNSDGYHNIVTITGCTIQDNTVSSTEEANGGGIYYKSGSGYNTATMAINDSVIKGNTANYGGGIYNFQSSLTISGSTIQENNAVVGAGISTSGTTSISDSLISDNIASNSGGGIHVEGGSLSVVDSSISNNTSIYGGGIINDGTLTLQSSAINDNTAQLGGGIYNYRDLIIDNSELLRNTAIGPFAYAGAIYNNNGAVTINNSNINNNTANALSTDSYGGGIYTKGGSLTVTNSNINHNTAIASSNIYGGGIYTYESAVTMNFNRIVGNSPKAIYHSPDSQYGTVNAEYNWWGSNDPEFTTLISGVVDYTPWLYMTINANPTTILQGETSTLTANFNNAYDGTTPTPLNPDNGHIPDKTPVTFNTDLGSVGSKTINKETTDGVATATLTADEAAGIAHVNAVTDSETVNTNVTIDPRSTQSSLYLTITPSKTNPMVGDTVIYTLKVGNKGPDTAENVVMTYVVPEGLEFAGANVDNGTYSYDPKTRTITWIIGDVPVGDPYMWLSLKVLSSGSYLINPLLSTSTNDPTLNINTQSLTFNAEATPNNNNNTNNNTNNNNTVNAATNTVTMQETGMPLVALVLAILMIAGGIIGTKK
jgi:uncharacterized repeat protein (TIGR01451 family)